MNKQPKSTFTVVPHVMRCWACVATLVTAGFMATALLPATAWGAVILDNTSNPGKAGVTTNLRTGVAGLSGGCTKSQALYDKTCNSFSIKNIQITQRDALDDLILDIGIDNGNATSYSNAGTDTELHYFTDGQHLFDLDKFRTAADAISALPTTLPAGTYGTITWEQFLDNVITARTMYGIVRVLVPLEPKGPGTNALNAPAPVVYGFCTTSQAACRCAPIRTGADINAVTDIRAGKRVCGKTIPSSAKIDVRGSLLVDFVDYQSLAPVPLSALPYSPRDIYFMVAVPISVNGANDDNGDGALDNIDAIAALTAKQTCAGGAASCSIPIDLSTPRKIDVVRDVPAESKSLYAAQAGKPLTQADFDLLPEADQYHWLMPSGYAQGWLDAFNALGITPAFWSSLGFDVGRSAGSFTLADIRSDAFEDIPAYMYTGGLVDMHYHVNVSGLVYVPQAVELEQLRNTSRQYVSGAVIVRDSFYIQDAGGVTLLTADPDSVSKIKVRTGKKQFVRNEPPATTSPSSTVTSPTDQSPSTDTSRNPQCDTQPQTPASCDNPGSADPTPATPPTGSSALGTQWMEIRPR